MNEACRVINRFVSSNLDNNVIDDSKTKEKDSSSLATRFFKIHLLLLR